MRDFLSKSSPIRALRAGRLFLFGLVLFLGAGLWGCKPPSSDGAQKPRVVATTTMIADLAGVIGGDRIDLVGILKAGGDPHTYQPLPKDAQAMARADLILLNGLHLEGNIEEQARQSGGKANLRFIADGVKELSDPNTPGNPDPHIWFDVRNWIIAVENVRVALTEIDPEGAEEFTSRAKAYVLKLEILDAKVRRALKCIPKAQRKLVTSHDAFQYFGESYGIELNAVLGVSTAVSLSGAHRASVEAYIRENKIPAIFTETSVSSRDIKAIQRSTGVKIGGELYSDSLGPEGSGADTYLLMFEKNMRLIVEGLSGKSLESCLKNDLPAKGGAL